MSIIRPAIEALQDSPIIEVCGDGFGNPGRTGERHVRRCTAKATDLLETAMDRARRTVARGRTGPVLSLHHPSVGDLK
jgi:hypothetical protein